MIIGDAGMTPGIMVIPGIGATITGGTAPGVMTIGIIPGVTTAGAMIPGITVLTTEDPGVAGVITAFTASVAT